MRPKIIKCCFNTIENSRATVKQRRKKTTPFSRQGADVLQLNAEKGHNFLSENEIEQKTTTDKTNLIVCTQYFDKTKMK